MKKTLLVIVISVISGSIMAQTPGAADQQSQDSKKVVVDEQGKVVDAKEVVKQSQLFSDKQQRILNNDFESAKSQYQENMRVLKANKNLSAEEYSAQKKKINSTYEVYKSRYLKQKAQLNEIVKEAKAAAADGVVTADETEKLKAKQDAAVATYKLDKKQNDIQKAKQQKP